MSNMYFCLYIYLNTYTCIHIHVYVYLSLHFTSFFDEIVCRINHGSISTTVSFPRFLLLISRNNFLEMNVPICSFTSKRVSADHANCLSYHLSCQPWLSKPMKSLPPLGNSMVIYIRPHSKHARWSTSNRLGAQRHRPSFSYQLALSSQHSMVTQSGSYFFTFSLTYASINFFKLHTAIPIGKCPCCSFLWSLSNSYHHHM